MKKNIKYTQSEIIEVCDKLEAISQEINRILHDLKEKLDTK